MRPWLRPSPVCSVLADVIAIAPNVLTFIQTRTQGSQGRWCCKTTPRASVRVVCTPAAWAFMAFKYHCPPRTIATVTVNTKRSSSFCIHSFPVMNVATSWLKGSMYYSSGADLQVVAAFIFHLSMNVATSLLRGSIYYSSGASPQTVATFILQSPG